MNKRVFLIENWWSYEENVVMVMFSEEEPTKEEATEYLKKNGNLGYAYGINPGNTTVAEYKDE